MSMGEREQVSIDPLLFEWPAKEPRLLGSRCSSCGAVAFPQQSSCARCCGEVVEVIALATRGTLWTWTIQGFAPKSPPYRGPVGDDFEPYGVGYIELPGEVRVEARLTTADPAELSIGQPMELVFQPFTQDDEGRDVISYAFRPAQHDS